MGYSKALAQQSLTLLSVFVNSFMYGAATSWIANARVFLVDIPGHVPSATTEQCSLMAQLFEAGRFAFAVPGGVLVDKMGRKRILISVGGLNFVSWIMLSLSSSLFLIYVARFLLGISVALLYVSAYSMIGEVASPHYRGTLTSINEVANMSGQLFESIVTVCTASYFALTNYTATLAAFFFPTIWWLIESPYYLTHAREFNRAKKNLKILRPGYTDDEIEEEFKVLKQSIDTEKSKKREINWFNFYKYKMVREPLRCALLLNTFAVSCGGPAMALNVADMLPPNPYFGNQYYPFISFSAQFAAGIGSIFVIDKFPRRKLFVFAALASAAMQAFSAAAFYAFATYASAPWKWSFVLNNFVYMFVDRGLISPLNCTVRSEIFPISVKGIGNALCVIGQSVALIISYAVFDVVKNAYGLTANFLIFTVFSLVLAVVVYAYLPEMGNKSLAEVQNALKTDAEERTSINWQVENGKC